MSVAPRSDNKKFVVAIVTRGWRSLFAAYSLLVWRAAARFGASAKTLAGASGSEKHQNIVACCESTTISVCGWSGSRR